MPLSQACRRENVHTRNLECRGFQRHDGLFDIEGRLVDTKSYDFPNEFRGTIGKGEPIHDMWLRLTIDEELVVHDAEAAMDAVPYAICPDITPAFKYLIGLSIGPGWSRRIRQRLGGTKGCTHLIELLQPLATVAFQTIVPARQRREAEECAKGQTPEIAEEKRPPQINSCHAYASDGEVVRKHWPRFFTGSPPHQGGKKQKGK